MKALRVDVKTEVMREPGRRSHRRQRLGTQGKQVPPLFLLMPAGWTHS